MDPQTAQVLTAAIAVTGVVAVTVAGLCACVAWWALEPQARGAGDDETEGRDEDAGGCSRARCRQAMEQLWRENVALRRERGQLTRRVEWHARMAAAQKHFERRTRAG